MDLILLQPGSNDVFPSPDSGANGGGLIDGDSWINEEIKLRPCIELLSLHQGMKQQITTDISNSARTSGRPIISEFTCVKYVDKTSVKLYDYCLRAKPLSADKNSPSKIFILRKMPENLGVIMTFQLRDAIISEIQLETHPDDMPTERFKLNFTEILWSHSVLQANSDKLDRLFSGWSLARNQPIAQFTD